MISGSLGALEDALGLVHRGVTWKARLGAVSIGACLQDRGFTTADLQ